jgi:hypothetical protein
MEPAKIRIKGPIVQEQLHSAIELVSRRRDKHPRGDSIMPKNAQGMIAHGSRIQSHSPSIDHSIRGTTYGSSGGGTAIRPHTLHADPKPWHLPGQLDSLAVAHRG